MMKERVLILLLCISLFPAIKLHTENVNGHFELSVRRNQDPGAIYVTVAPNRDKQIKGVSEEQPFIMLESADVVFENKGILIRTDYITEPAREVLVFPFTPVDPDQALTQLEVHLTMTYVPCVISTGVCLFPATIERDYSLKVSGSVVPTEIINTVILAAFFILAVAGLVVYFRTKKDILFTALFILIFSGMLFYTFIRADENGVSQADLSRDIARTLCLSCIGIESAGENLPVNRSVTEFYARLEKPVLITIFSAPWCGTCPYAKAYVKELCSMYPETLSYEVVEISEPEGKEKFAYYDTLYRFEEPLPLPAIVVSVNKKDVLYGISGLEANLIKLITKGADE